MQFITVLRKPHVANKYAIAHLRITISIVEKKEVLTINAKPLLRKLCPECTPFFHY